MVGRYSMVEIRPIMCGEPKRAGGLAWDACNTVGHCNLASRGTVGDRVG